LNSESFLGLWELVVFSEACRLSLWKQLASYRSTGAPWLLVLLVRQSALKALFSGLTECFQYYKVWSPRTRHRSTTSHTHIWTPNGPERVCKSTNFLWWYQPRHNHVDRCAHEGNSIIYTHLPWL